MKYLFNLFKRISLELEHNISKVRFPSESSLVVLSMVMVSAFIFSSYWNGENSYVLIHDNLDSNVVWYRVLSHYNNAYFSLSEIIPNIMNGVPVYCISSSLNIGVLLHVFLGTFPAIVINEVLVRMVAFWGMYLLLRRHLVRQQPLVAVGVALCFSLLPFWPSGFLSVAGQPFMIHAFLNIRNERDNCLDWLVIMIYPFYSSLVLAGFALVMLLAILPVVDVLRGKRVAPRYLFGLGVLGGLYLAANFRLVYAVFMDGGFVSHRTAFQAKIFSFGKTLRVIKENFLSGQYHAASLHGRYIVFSVATAFAFVVMRRKTDKRVPFFLLLCACLALSVFYGMWKYFEPSLPDHILLTGFQWERVHFLHPLLWHLLFAFSLCIVLDVMRKYQKVAVALVFFLISFQAAYAIQKSDAFREKSGSGITFSGFFSTPLFAEISNYIDQPKSSYRVASLGLHPAIAQYNGFYTLDGYLANYSLDYKIRFRKIIAEELSKNPRLKRSFDGWGNRCYLVSSDVGYFFLNQKESNHEVRDLDIDTGQFVKMGGRYIFSAVPVLNCRENGLRLRKVFEREDSPWRIWLYEAVATADQAA